MATDRLGRWLAHAGVASRRGCDRLLEQGRVTVNGRRAPAHGAFLDPELDLVEVDGRPVSSPGGDHRYLALNKPLGVVSTVSDPEGRPTVMGMVPDPIGLFPVGRLDFDSRGLLLLTDDGELAQRLTHPRYQVPKTYRVVVAGRLEPGQLERLRQGPPLSDGPTHPQAVRLGRSSSRRSELVVTMAEGRQRQLRRMCAAVGAEVLDLERIEIAGLRLGTQPEGSSRELAEGELRRLRRLVGLD